MRGLLISGMEELIKIEEHDGIQAVSARELHSFLESRERFSKWFKRQLQFGFVESIDYTPYQMVHPLNNQESDDYALTIDCAKEISMLQRSEKGKQARHYFIACEKKLREIQNNNLIEKIENISKRLEILEQKQESYITLPVSQLNYLLNDAKGKLPKRLPKESKDSKKIYDFASAINCVQANLSIPEGNDGERTTASGIINKLIEKGKITPKDILPGFVNINAVTIGKALTRLGFQPLKFRLSGGHPVNGWYVKFKE